MAIFGARGIRHSIRRAYRKHLTLYEQEHPADGISPHHAALHGTLVLRYAASYRSVPEALVWLELTPFLPLEPEPAVWALAEYVVFKERGRDDDRGQLRAWLREGLSALSREDREGFVAAAGEHRFAWLRLLEGR